MDYHPATDRGLRIWALVGEIVCGRGTVKGPVTITIILSCTNLLCLLMLFFMNK